LSEDGDKTYLMILQRVGSGAGNSLGRDDERAGLQSSPFCGAAVRYNQRETQKCVMRVVPRMSFVTAFVPVWGGGLYFFTGLC
jgi:hypothetical protein